MNLKWIFGLLFFISPVFADEEQFLPMTKEMILELRASISKKYGIQFDHIGLDQNSIFYNPQNDGQGKVYIRDIEDAWVELKNATQADLDR